jgi:hypothetical protein
MVWIPIAVLHDRAALNVVYDAVAETCQAWPHHPGSGTIKVGSAVRMWLSTSLRSRSSRGLLG